MDQKKEEEDEIHVLVIEKSPKICVGLNTHEILIPNVILGSGEGAGIGTPRFNVHRERRGGGVIFEVEKRARGVYWFLYPRKSRAARRRGWSEGQSSGAHSVGR